MRHAGRQAQAHLKVLEAIFLGRKCPSKAQGKGEDSGAHILRSQYVGQ